MKSKILLSSLLVLTITTKTISQKFKGCETLLMNGVFNTFNQQAGTLSTAKWHQAWCNGTVKQETRGGQTSVSLDVVVEQIPIGLSFADAQNFQSIYKSINCGTNDGATLNLETNSVIVKVASPELLNAYVKCKQVEKSGLEVNLSLRPSDKKVFVIDAKFNGNFGTADGPKVTKISFVPNVISVREGDLQEGVGLKPGKPFSLICERSVDVPLTILVSTEVGVFTADLPSFVPPPTDEEKVMAALPRGTILGWFNPLNIPRGWVICDGRSGTPNLNDRFPLGSTTNLGDQTGNASITPSGVADITKKTGDKAWDINPRQHEDGQAVAWTRDASQNKIPLDMQPISLIPPATKIMFIMKL